MRARLAGKTALVTGATGGIGAAVVRRLAAEGASVVITDLDAGPCEKLAEEVGGGALGLALDVSDESAWSETVATAYTIEDRVGIKLTPVFVNAVEDDGPDLDEDATVGDVVDAADADALRAAARFRCERLRVQRSAIDQLAASLPLDQLHVPYAAGRIDGAVVSQLARSVRR